MIIFYCVFVTSQSKNVMYFLLDSVDVFVVVVFDIDTDRIDIDS